MLRNSRYLQWNYFSPNPDFWFHMKHSQNSFQSQNRFIHRFKPLWLWQQTTRPARQPQAASCSECCMGGATQHSPRLPAHAWDHPGADSSMSKASGCKRQFLVGLSSAATQRHANLPVGKIEDLHSTQDTEMKTLSFTWNLFLWKLVLDTSEGWHPLITEGWPAGCPWRMDTNNMWMQTWNDRDI